MLKLTAAAIKQIEVATKQGDASGLALRLAANRDENGSINYLIGFDEPKEDDFKITTDGVTVVIEPEYINLLDGAVMDFVEIKPNDFRFIFINPNDKNHSAPLES